MGLPAIQERQSSIQALLHAVSELVDSGESGLVQDESAVWIVAGCRCEHYQIGHRDHWGMDDSSFIRIQSNVPLSKISDSGHEDSHFDITDRPILLRKPGSFCGLRLLQGREAEGALQDLPLKVARELFERPPYDLRWIRGLAANVQVGS